MTTLYMQSVAVASEVRDVLAPILRRDQDLGRRLKRACDEVPEHLSEGMCTTGRTRRAEYNAALAAAKEALACVHAAVGVGYLSGAERQVEAHIEQLIERMHTDLAPRSSQLRVA